MSWTTDGDTVRLPTTPLQPVAAAEAVDALADVATGSPLNGILDVAGGRTACGAPRADRK